MTMQIHLKNRPRLLIISKDNKVQNDLVTLLTGYGYYVDYVVNRTQAVAKFKNYKHAVVIIDFKTYINNGKRLFTVLKAIKKNPVVCVTANKDEEPLTYKYLQSGLYDIIQLPLKVEYLDFVLNRLIDNASTSVNYEFLKLLIMILFYATPLFIMSALLLRWSGI
jgi:DNA-binding response OmpR family regulator